MCGDGEFLGEEEGLSAHAAEGVHAMLFGGSFHEFVDGDVAVAAGAHFGDDGVLHRW